MVAELAIAVAILCSSQAKARATSSTTLRAIEYLAREAPRWSRENSCFSCHNNGDAARVLYAAAAHGYAVPAGSLADTTGWLRTPAQWDHNRVNPVFSDKKLARIQFAAALTEAYDSGAIRERSALVAAAESLTTYQEADGSFVADPGSAVGSPVTYGTALATYLARRTLDRAGLHEAAAKANRWLAAARPHSVLDAAALLLAIPSRRDCLDLILAAQSSDGGWGPHAMAPAEAFDTAVALLALKDHHQARAISRGRGFLIAGQQADGGWQETTRPPGGQSYAQHISTSAWATLALVLTDSDR